MNWQPIETAPIKPFDQDNWWQSATPSVLVAFENGGIRIATYSYTQTGKGRWRDQYGSCNPTHWMPLPEPPAV